MSTINIAIDGYAGCGKSTLARDLAKALNFTFVDSGAMYRGLTHLVLHSETNMDDEGAISDLLKSNPSLEFADETNHLLLNGEDVEDSIRNDKRVANNVSTVAAIGVVRAYLKAVQQSLIEEKSVVMEGRDIGTVIMPNAELKLFVTADMEERVTRRFLQLQESGKELSRDEVRENLASRDHMDETRDIAPLKKADDAIVLDTTILNREEQLTAALGLYSDLSD
ncbi:MAG: (d)CMP kinase [Flavobacteriales bacterium]|jgi:CMP/dCMP kinase|nr:(d)CMP kinase [Flavobacteriales bacterium]MBT4704286.1 (d)CMP kinase [Flavobacteriales bacterium]MBT6132090.1 (d)CMP kinase [Flavobacteriales bacterium]MBT6917213.1 (d)CMP kinase [Flavobacteriales bacterium]MBT6979478.1 (d)CMP kinase [Flavobacteriales bacterium]